MIANEVFAPNGLLEVCQGWQEVISTAPDFNTEKDAMTMAQEALRPLEQDGFFGTRKIIAKSEVALVFKSRHNVVETAAYDDVVAKGWLGKISFLSLGGQRLITWPLFEAQVMNPHEEEVGPLDVPEIDTPQQMPTDKIRIPIYLPVGMIDYAICTS